ncbi:hypothetical protein SmJEL517_g03955 [Synchytrium microbalum]|uniref:UspA domain-containing protein n=1 Tax=Synchytrium microbalum TaxID=1806994 RepID=A0A507C4S2_9FUNG|nr:uncharacterized protein SmJEL517_g03955 [Synchytrium microbalum]TPX33124.1 hypothetical protein SmJEL517_g03955 [Synchytrium microbalum]
MTIPTLPSMPTTTAPEVATSSFRKILVGVDESEHGIGALKFAINEVARDNDDIILVNARGPGGLLMNADAKKEHDDKEVLEGKVKLGGILNDLIAASGKKLGGVVNVEVGDSRSVLMSAVDTFKPTIAVVGARGISGVKALLLGSTSTFLIHNSEVPVIVVRNYPKLDGAAAAATGTTTATSTAAHPTGSVATPLATAPVSR